MPRARAPPARSETTPAGRWRAATSVAKRLFDLRHDPVRRMEEAGLHLRPPVQPQLRRVDREQAGRLVELVVLRDALHDWAEPLRGERLLGRRRPEELVERLRRRLLETALRERDRRLDQQRR